MISLFANTPQGFGGRIISLPTPRVVRTHNSCPAGPLSPQSYMPNGPQLYQLNSPFQALWKPCLPLNSQTPPNLQPSAPVLSKSPSFTQTSQHSPYLTIHSSNTHGMTKASIVDFLKI